MPMKKTVVSKQEALLVEAVSTAAQEAAVNIAIVATLNIQRVHIPTSPHLYSHCAG